MTPPNAFGRIMTVILSKQLVFNVIFQDQPPDDTKDWQFRR